MYIGLSANITGGVFISTKVIKRKKKIVDLIEDFLEYCSYKNLSNKTIKSYNQTLVLFMRYLEEEKDSIDINKEIVQEYIIFTRNKGKYSFVASTDGMIKANIDKRNDIGEQVSDDTLNNYLRNIKVFFYWLDENHIIK
ncbi:site-specific integrase [Clostridium botulinum]|uniref:site-specific integrase n=1 Tax=Clostridium botulinum TaxID=1491 RepID=UPI003DA635D9